jgi:hypothetical protein
MKSRISLALVVGALCIVGSAGAQANARSTTKAAAPAPSPAATPVTRAGTPAATVSPSQALGVVDSARAYDSQALRYETRWGSADVRRGASGTVIGTVGWFRDFDVEQVVASSPRAVAEARTFKTENFRGSVASSIGALTFATGLVLTANSSNNAATPVLIIAGAGGMAWGAAHLQLGFSALTRAFWWYNRDLSR